MSLFSREPGAPWQLEALTDRFVVVGTSEEDDQSSAAMFLRAQFREAPMTRLRLGSPRVRSLDDGPAPAPTGAWTMAYGSALVALIPRDDASLAHSLSVAGKPAGPATAHAGPFRITGTLLAGSPGPEVAAQSPSFEMTDVQISVAGAPTGVTIDPAPFVIVFTNQLHALEF